MGQSFQRPYLTSFTTTYNKERCEIRVLSLDQNCNNILFLLDLSIPSVSQRSWSNLLSIYLLQK